MIIRALLTIASMFSALPSHAQTRAAAEAEQLLKGWEPLSIVQNDGTLTVRLSRRRVTNEIFFAAITSGICFAPLLEMTLEGVEEIEILNGAGSQGLVYEGGIEDCDELSDIPVAEEARRNALIFGKTRLY